MDTARIGRKIKFVGDANKKANVGGNFSLSKVTLYDDFLGDVLADEWTPSGNNGGTEAITAGSGGTVTLTTGGTDDDRSILSGGLNWYCAKNPVMEVRCKVDRITGVGINIGFNDAVTEGDNVLAASLDAGVATQTAGMSDDNALFLFDTDGSPDYWYYAAGKATAKGVPVVIGTTTPGADTYHTYRIALDTLGNARFYVDGLAVGFLAACITTTDPLCPFVGVINRANTGAVILAIDYIKCWQDR